MPHKEVKPPSYEDVVGCQIAMFEWAESFDTKDWDRLSKCIAPELYVDYRPIGFQMWESMPAEDFVGLSSSKGFLGNIRIKTQHFVGASRWVKEADGKITGYHQMRVAHQKYKDDERKEVAFQGHAHGKATTQYTLVDGEWKFSGLIPDIRWTEFDYDQIFTDY